MNTGVSVTTQPYDQELTLLMRRFSDDMYALVEPYAYVRKNPEVALKIWRNANRIVDTGSGWGSLVPGVSLDCLGAVMTVSVLSELYRIPKGVMARLATSPLRACELNGSNVVLHRRMVGLLSIMAWKYAREGCQAVPIVNPTAIIPGDILLFPHMIVVNGMVTLPHAMICVGPTKTLSANPSTATIQIIDTTTIESDAATRLAVANTCDTLFAVRLLEGMKAEDMELAQFHVARCSARIREIIREKDPDFAENVE